MKNNPAKSLNKKYISAISIIVCLIVISQLILQYALSSKDGDGTKINLAGRQRMLSERVVKHILASIETKSEISYKNNLQHSEDAILELTKVHHALRYGDRKLGLTGVNSDQITRELETVDIFFKRMQNIYTNYQRVAKDNKFFNRDDKAIIAQIDLLIDAQSSFLNQMEKIVSLYEQDLADQVKKIQQFEIGLFLFTLIIILLEIVYIFMPATRTISEQWTNLVHANKTLEEEKQKTLFFLKKAEENNQAKTQFLSNMSHEMRTPLNGILGLGNLLEMTKLDDTQKEYVHLITESGNNLLHTIENILVHSQSIDSESLILKRPFNIHQTVEIICEKLKNKYKNKELTFQLTIDQSIPKKITTDKEKFSLILKNILDNAFKFTEAGKIECNIKQIQTDLLQICINDTGIGMTDEVKRQIFDSFNQSDNSSTRKYGGAGLGLTVAKQLIDANGGSITIESIPSKSTRVTYTLNIN